MPGFFLSGRSDEPFEFTVNLQNIGGFANAWLTPEGDILFVNTFGDDTPGSGMTCAITAPWRKCVL